MKSYIPLQTVLSPRLCNLVCIAFLTEGKQVLYIFTFFFNYFQTNTSVSKLFHSYFKKPIFIHVFISLLTFSCTYDLLETFHCVLFSGCHWNTSLETSCTELHFQNCTSQKICFYTFAHFYTFTRSDLVSSLIQDTGLVSLPMRPLVNIIHQSK